MKHIVYFLRNKLVLLLLAMVAHATGTEPKPPLRPVKIAELPYDVALGGPLLFARNGWIYGISGGGGVYNEGFIYAVNLAGEAKILVHFDHRTRGAHPVGPLVETADGAILGMTILGGVNQFGTVYRVAPSDEFRTLFNFRLGKLVYPSSGLVIAPWPPYPILGGFEGLHREGGLFEVDQKGEVREITDVPKNLVSGGDIRLLISNRADGQSGIIAFSSEWNIFEFGAEGKFNHLETPNAKHYYFPSGCEVTKNIEVTLRARYELAPVLTSTNSLIYPKPKGGRFGDGELVAHTPGKSCRALRAFNTSNALGGSLSYLALGPNDELFAVIGRTFAFGGRARPVSLPNGAVCRVKPDGELELLWALNATAPAQSLSWHDGSLYWAAGTALYRLDLAPSSAP